MGRESNGIRLTYCIETVESQTVKGNKDNNAAMPENECNGGFSPEDALPSTTEPKDPLDLT